MTLEPKVHEDFFAREGKSLLKIYDYSGCDVYIAVEDLYQMFRQRYEAETQTAKEQKP